MKRFFRRPTPREVVARRLAETELRAIDAEADLEAHQAHVTMLRARATRLRKQLHELTKEASENAQ